MATKYCGSDFLIQVDIASTFTTIGSMRSTSMTINNETVDVTDKDSSGWRELVAGCGIRSMSLSGSGIFSDDVALEDVLEQVMAGTILNFKLISGAGDTFAGAFQGSSFERAGEYNAEETYSFTLESSGVVART